MVRRVVYGVAWCMVRRVVYGVEWCRVWSGVGCGGWCMVWSGVVACMRVGLFPYLSICPSICACLFVRLYLIIRPNCIIAGPIYSRRSPYCIALSSVDERRHIVLSHQLLIC